MIRLRSHIDLRKWDQCQHACLRGTFAEQFLILVLELSLSIQVGERVADRCLMVLKGSSTIAAEKFLVLARELSLSVQVGE
jgi:hypothetical protein